MERVSLFLLIFYSVPESILLISLGAGLYGYDVRKNFRNIFKLSICLAIITYLLRFLPITFGINAVIEIPLFILLTRFFLKTSFLKTFLIIFTGMVAIALTENLVYLIVTTVTGLKISYFFQNGIYKAMLGFTLLAVLALLNGIIYKKKWSFISATKLISSTSLDTKITILIVVILLQAFLAGLLQLLSYFQENSIYPIFVDSGMLKLIIGASLITIPIVSIFILKKIFTLAEKEAVAVAQEAYIDNINSLFLTIRAQRHDFINHVQILYSMLQLGKTADSLAYMQSVLGGINEVNELIKLKNPGLGALLNTNSAIAEAKGIRFEPIVEASFESVGVKSLDLVRIIGNLIRNAIEAVEVLPVEDRSIKVTMKKMNSAFVVEVLNSKPVIPQEMLDTIFQAGFSTKRKEHSGIGLAIVKKLVEKYNGQIGVKSNEHAGTTFTVIIPE